MGTARRLILILLVVGSCAGCDRLSKSYAESWLPEAQPLSFFSESVRLQLTYNQGAFLSLGSSLPQSWRKIVFRTGIACLLFAVLGYTLFFAPPRPWSICAASLVLAGGASNLIDRFIYDGYVLDFIQLGIGSLRTGVFNVADVAIMAGVVMLLTGEPRGRRRRL